MDQRSGTRRSSNVRETGSHRTASERKTSQVSYRSKGPASSKRATSDSRYNTRTTSGTSQRREAVNAEYRPVSRKTEKQKENRYHSRQKNQNTQNQQNSRTMPNSRNTQSTHGAPSGRNPQNTYRTPAKKKKNRGCGCLPTIFLLLIIVLGLYFGVRQVFCSMFDKIEKNDLDFEQITINDQDKNINKFTNIALFGVDNQDNQIYNKGSRTDCIMVASINNRTKKVKLMSIYRDTYVSIDGKYDKINAAYSYGGPELAISTINRNLDLNIRDFATVNFKALADAVDELGGITLTVKSEKERQNLNDYIGNMNKINGGKSPKFDKPADYPFTATFDGNQAVAYSRIRYMNGGDHERANHQRLVVEGIVKQVKKKPWKLISLINVVLPQCKTSLSSKEMWKLSRSLVRYELVNSQAYPFHSQDEKYNGIYYGFPLTTYSNTVQAHEYLFGTKDYEPSEELSKISQKVKNAAAEIGLE